MCDEELLVGYLYDEVEPSERHAFETHLQVCSECREELKAFRATRTQLASWNPAEPALEFQIVRGGARQVPSYRRWIAAPAWGLAAAAVLVLAVASAIANVEVKYGPDGLTVRTGWARPGAPGAASAPAAAAGVTATAAEDTALRAQVREISARLRTLESAASTPPGGAVRMASAQASPTDLLRQVRQMLAESENRQEQ